MVCMYICMTADNLMAFFLIVFEFPANKIGVLLGSHKFIRIRAQMTRQEDFVEKLNSFYQKGLFVIFFPRT